MPKDIKREFPTGPRKFDDIMEKLEMIINEMMADDGPTPTDLGNVCAYDAKTMQCWTWTRATTCTKTCVPSRGREASKGAGKKGTEGIGNMASWKRN